MAFSGVMRAAGRAFDKFGLGLQGRLTEVTKIVPSTTAVAVADALPNSSQASFIAPNAMIAGDVTVRSGSSAWYGTVLRGDFGEPTQVGASSHVHERTVVSSSTIGDNVIVGANSTIHGCTVEDGAYIGHNVRLVNVNVGSQAIVGSGSVVASTDIPSKQLWGGIPGSFQRAVTEQDLDSTKLQLDDLAELCEDHQYENTKSIDEVREEFLQRQIEARAEYYQSKHV